LIKCENVRKGDKELRDRWEPDGNLSLSARPTGMDMLGP